MRVTDLVTLVYCLLKGTASSTFECSDITSGNEDIAWFIVHMNNAMGAQPAREPGLSGNLPQISHP